MRREALYLSGPRDPPSLPSPTRGEGEYLQFGRREPLVHQRNIPRCGEEKALCWLSEQPLDGGANAAPFDRLDRRTRLRAERTERRELLPPEPRVSQKPHRSLARSARLSVGPGVGHDAEDLRVVADRVVAFGARAEIGVAIDPAAIEPEQRREREGEAGGR